MISECNIVRMLQCYNAALDAADGVSPVTSQTVLSEFRSQLDNLIDSKTPTDLDGLLRLINERDSDCRCDSCHAELGPNVHRFAVRTLPAYTIPGIMHSSRTLYQ